MGYGRLTDRLVFDIKFLLWRAEVHLLPSDEIASRYREIERQYLALAEKKDRRRLKAELRAWEPQLHQVAARNARTGAALPH